MSKPNQGLPKNNAQTPMPPVKPARSDGESQENPAAASPGGETLVTVILRHTTPYPVYRRAGQILTQVAKQYQVTPDQLEVLQADAWVKVGVDEVAQEDAEV